MELFSFTNGFFIECSPSFCWTLFLGQIRQIRPPVFKVVPNDIHSCPSLFISQGRLFSSFIGLFIHDLGQNDLLYLLNEVLVSVLGFELHINMISYFFVGTQSILKLGFISKHLTCIQRCIEYKMNQNLSKGLN